MKLTGASTTFTLVLASSVSAQTYSKCNPTQQSCAPDPALGTSASISFTSGESSDFTGTGNGISYGSSGAQLTVAKSGDNPTLTSDWYIMFGKVDFKVKTAPGTGMVSSAILISDDLDEIDWEILGADATQAQTNYFSKGVTGSYDRGSFISAPTSQTDFNTYTIDWTADQLVWQLNGDTVRTLTYSSSGGQYPQSPMQVKVGAWAGGDSTNAEGTIEWAGGPINYADGPYSMYVESITVQDYSTGTQYKYEGTSGSWQDITAVGGSINGAAGSSASGSSGSSSSPTTNGGSSATWTGTHQETSAFVTPSTYPWVPASSAAPTGSSSAAGPPASSHLASQGYDTASSAPATHNPASSPTPLASPSSAAVSVAVAGCETITTYDQEGFATAVVVPSGFAQMPKSYDNNGFLITPTFDCGPARPTGVERLANIAAPATTAKPVANEGNQANMAEANSHSSQARNDMTFYQTTEGSSSTAFTGNGAGRTGAGFALVGFVTAALALLL